MRNIYKKPMKLLMTLILIIQLSSGVTYTEELAERVDKVPSTEYYTLTADDVVMVGNTIEEFIGDTQVIGTNIIIPNQINGIDVKAIGRAFEEKNLTNVKIPEGVTSIGQNAFAYNYLKHVEIPKNVEYIGGYAFAYNYLTHLDIQEGVKNINGYAFAYNDLTYVDIPESVKNIEECLFYSNDLSSINISNGVTSIGEGAFAYNRLKSVTIPEGVTNIGDSAFSSNNLISITIPESVMNIDDFAFYFNEISHIEIPDNEINISDNAFERAFEANGQLTIKGIRSVSGSYLNSVNKMEDLYYYGGTRFLDAEKINGGTQLYWGRHEVRFLNYDGRQIGNTLYLRHGANAIPPKNPIRPNYNFTGWDTSLTNIENNLTVNATFKRE